MRILADINNKKMKQKFLILIIACLIINKTKAQLSKQEKDNVIDSAIALMNKAYIFPDVAQNTVAYIRNQQKNKVYDTINDVNAFANKLTADFVKICHDKHVRIFYSADIIPYRQLNKLMSIPDEEKAGYNEFLKHMNYGITKIDVLSGNIGYIDFNFLCGTEFAGDVYTAMMNYLAHTEALIIDLRNCGGSFSPNAVPFLCSYFFANPTHLKDTHYKDSSDFEQAWTYAYVPGAKYTDKPIYILVSNKTFSGAEEMAYDLKALKRATIIGQQTGGGANPGGELRLTEHFGMFIPVAQVTNPITKTSWEGVGITPDSICSTKLALYTAQLMSMKNSLAKTKDQNWKNGLQQWITDLENNPPQLKQIVFTLKGFDNAKDVFVTGSFNDWNASDTKLEYKNGEWTATVTAEPGEIMYKFIVDGNYILDPANTDKKTENGYDNSVKIVK